MLFERCDVKHITLFHSFRKFLVLENQQEILHALLGGKEKVTLNRSFNCILIKKLC